MEGRVVGLSNSNVGRDYNLKDLNPYRKHGFSAEPVSVFAYIGSSKNLKDLKFRCLPTMLRARRT